jgi:2,4-dienoyl-CoA reductase-like NADH-dependent reductase (Old Yellow Enzyme family)
MQIGHNGVQARTAAQTGADYMAVSLTDNMPDFGRKPRVMHEEDIENIINAFGQAARRAQEAEFDGVQIHGAHGYLVSQFLSRRANKRTDKWGGSLENRTRFVVEVTRTIKKRVGKDFPVMIKLGCKEYLEDEEAFSIEEGAQVSRKLEDEGICLIEISHSSVAPLFRKSFLGITSPEKEAGLLPEARILRKTITVPIALVMGMRSLPVMEKIIQSGVADFISLCRPLIREPGLIKRWKDGDTRPADCISCTGTDHASQYGCFNLDENGKLCVYCRQLKKSENRTG